MQTYRGKAVGKGTHIITGFILAIVFFIALTACQSAFGDYIFADCDFNGDHFVDFFDYAMLASAWMTQQGDPNWNPTCDISSPQGIIDLPDLQIFGDYWLTGRSSQRPSQAIWVRTSIILKTGSVVDWYNYDANDLAAGLQIGTDSIEAGAIMLNTGSVVNADVVVGVGGDPASVITGDGDVNGLVYVATEPYAWVDPVLPPPGLPVYGDIDTSMVITQSGQYSSINFRNGEVLTIDAPVTLYITGNINLRNAAQLQITSNGSLALYAGGTVVCDNSGSINSLAQDPKKLRIYGLATCMNVDLKVNGAFYGTIYAPDAAVITRNAYPFYGAIAVKSFEQKVGMQFMYDASVQD